MKEILDALMGGSSYESLQTCIEELPTKDRRELLCTVCCLRDEIANNCLQRAEEVDQVLANNGHALPPSRCRVPELDGGVCLLTEASIWPRTEENCARGF